MKPILKKMIFTTLIIIMGLKAFGQETNLELKRLIENMNRQFENLNHRLDMLEKRIDDVLWYDKVGDIAFVDKVRLTGPPLRVEKNPTAQGAGNPFRFWSYVFIPQDIDRTKKYPLIVFPRSGIHANFDTRNSHIIRELMAQQYIVVAVDYRGSTGYGRDTYEAIDYGGLEIEDVEASRAFMLENYNFIDKNRVGIIGWSHGGLIALLCIFEYPQNYKAAFAGVPVSDLVARMGYKTQEYRDLFSADYHIGKTAYENVNEYRRRSPAWQAHKLQTPLLINTNTNDEDVNVLEVEHLIKSLKAYDKEFEYKIYQDLPGGHSFDRLDTKLAKEIRLKMYRFLERYLDPPRKFRNLEDLHNASYSF